MKLTIEKKRVILHRLLCLCVGFSIGFGIGALPIHETVGQVEEKPVVTEVVEQVQPVSNEPTYITIENVKLTAYCKENYPHICNNGDASTTATGTVPTPGRTIAVDPTVVPYGTEVIIFGHSYIAEDCGGSVKGNEIDICCETHEEALRFGVRYADVKIKVVGDYV